jgi:LysM repeat protein
VLVTGYDVEPPAPTKTPEPTQTPEPTETPELIPTVEPAPPPAVKADEEGGVIPPPGNYTVQDGEHLMQIARDLSLNWRAIAEMNQLPPPYQLYPGQVLTLPGQGVSPPEDESDESFNGDTYTVHKGEYLYAIGKNLGINWRELADFNGIRSPYIVYPNQVLRIP